MDSKKPKLQHSGRLIFIKFYDNRRIYTDIIFTPLLVSQNYLNSFFARDKNESARLETEYDGDIILSWSRKSWKNINFCKQIRVKNEIIVVLRLLKCSVLPISIKFVTTGPLYIFNMRNWIEIMNVIKKCDGIETVWLKIFPKLCQLTMDILKDKISKLDSGHTRSLSFKEWQKPLEYLEFNMKNMQSGIKARKIGKVSINLEDMRRFAPFPTNPYIEVITLSQKLACPWSEMDPDPNRSLDDDFKMSVDFKKFEKKWKDEHLENILSSCEALKNINPNLKLKFEALNDDHFSNSDQFVLYYQSIVSNIKALIDSCRKNGYNGITAYKVFRRTHCCGFDNFEEEFLKHFGGEEVKWGVKTKFNYKGVEIDMEQHYFDNEYAYADEQKKSLFEDD